VVLGRGAALDAGARGAHALAVPDSMRAAPGAADPIGYPSATCRPVS
jgi:hypothetical protein